MKIKPLISFIPFRILDKYKYAYFVINSFVFALLTTLFLKLLNQVIDIGIDFTLRQGILQFFVMWSFAYPLSFIAYEKAKKRNKKLQEEQNNKREE